MPAQRRRSAGDVGTRVTAAVPSVWLYQEVFGRGHYHVAGQILAGYHVSHGPGPPPATGSASIKRQAQPGNFPARQTFLPDAQDLRL